jgi:hypothetical protein
MMLGLFSVICLEYLLLFIVWCKDMPYKQRFQHRKKAERERRARRSKVKKNDDLPSTSVSGSDLPLTQTPQPPNQMLLEQLNEVDEDPFHQLCLSVILVLQLNVHVGVIKVLMWVKRKL